MNKISQTFKASHFRLLVGAGLLTLISVSGSVMAQPYGRGVYGANVPYGSQTSLTIATNGNVLITITPTTTGALGTGVSNVTVTSTDVVGYKLYIRSDASTNMVNGAATLPPSANGSPAALAVNTWGYNTDASSNFVGTSLTDALIVTGNGPFSSGAVTAVTYGVKVDNAKPAGNYTNTIAYTAVPQTD